MNASLTREYGGIGLGLALGKQLAELMGGTMWEESPPLSSPPQEGRPLRDCAPLGGTGGGAGSTFHFTIQAQAAEGAWPMYLEKAQPKLRDKRVLVVDDDLAIRKALILQTQDWGMAAVAVASGTDALDLIQLDEQFDVAILDAQMGEMDGLTLASEMRQACPLVMSSSSEQDGEGIEVAAFLPKPIEAWRLYNALVTIFAGEVYLDHE